MKRASLLSVLMVCWLAGQASAGPYTLDSATALEFRQILAPGSSGLLMGVFDGTAWVYQNPLFPATAYPAIMQDDVGFVGALSGNQSWMRIGLEDSFGDYDGFRMFVGNDDQSTWDVRLVADDLTSNWVSIPVGESASLELTFASTALTRIGFDLRLNTGLPNPPSLTDTFHISVVPLPGVPLPGAFILGMLGLAVGLKLRRFV